jgi:hypothetical protein
MIPTLPYKIHVVVEFLKMTENFQYKGFFKLMKSFITKIIFLAVMAIIDPGDPPSKAWVCGRSLAWIAGSNPTGTMAVSLL